jgi:hypothetical protein
VSWGQKEGAGQVRAGFHAVPNNNFLSAWTLTGIPLASLHMDRQGPLWELSLQQIRVARVIVAAVGGGQHLSIRRRSVVCRSATQACCCGS